MGQQVANNRTLHHVMEIFTNSDGEWYIVSQPQSRPALIKGEYLPVGNKLVYPKKWGRKKAAEILLNHLLDDAHRLLNNTQLRLIKLENLKADVDKWKEE